MIWGYRFFISVLLSAISISGSIDVSIANTYDTGLALELSQDHAGAAKVYAEASQRGDVRAMMRLAQMYFAGLGISQNLEAGAALVERAALLNYPEAQYRAGLLYLRGQGFARDASKAANWFGRAAGQGHPEAMYQFALYLKNNEPARGQDAVTWFENAARAGVWEAFSTLAEVYVQGEVVPRDLARAYGWLLILEERLISAGHSQIEVELAKERLHSEGLSMAERMEAERQKAHWLANSAQ